MTTAAEIKLENDFREIGGELLDEIKENGIQFEILASVPHKDGLVLKLKFPTSGSSRDAQDILKDYIKENLPTKYWYFTSGTAADEFTVMVSNDRQYSSQPTPALLKMDNPDEVERDVIPFSSEDEAKAEEPKDIAIKLVRQQLEAEGSTADSIYVVWFAYIVGNWKALVSTSLADGRYYEVTHSATKDETYVDTYEKIRNEVHSDESLTK